jgi:hypothetical protein
MVNLDDLLIKPDFGKLFLAKGPCKEPSLIQERFKFYDISPL